MFQRRIAFFLSFLIVLSIPCAAGGVAPADPGELASLAASFAEHPAAVAQQLAEKGASAVPYLLPFLVIEPPVGLESRGAVWPDGTLAALTALAALGPPAMDAKSKKVLVAVAIQLVGAIDDTAATITEASAQLEASLAAGRETSQWQRRIAYQRTLKWAGVTKLELWLGMAKDLIPLIGHAQPASELAERLEQGPALIERSRVLLEKFARAEAD